MLSLFSRAYWPSVYLLWGNVYLDFLPILDGAVYLFFWYWVVWAICPLWTLSPYTRHTFCFCWRYFDLGSGGAAFHCLPARHLPRERKTFLPLASTLTRAPLQNRSSRHFLFASPSEFPKGEIICKHSIPHSFPGIHSDSQDKESCIFTHWVKTRKKDFSSMWNLLCRFSSQTEPLCPEGPWATLQLSHFVVIHPTWSVAPLLRFVGKSPGRL